MELVKRILKCTWKSKGPATVKYEDGKATFNEDGAELGHIESTALTEHHWWREPDQGVCQALYTTDVTAHTNREAGLS